MNNSVEFARIPPELRNRVLVTDCCWWWTGRALSGRAVLTEPLVNVARLVLAYTHGDLGPLSALHTCDNALCVRPTHLYAGTTQRNVRDAIARGRWRPHGTTPAPPTDMSACAGTCWPYGDNAVHNPATPAAVNRGSQDAGVLSPCPSPSRHAL